MALKSSKEDNTYATKPQFTRRFRPQIVKEAIRQVLEERLSGQDYSLENTPTWAREISDEIRNKMKGTITFCNF
jgi:hypothetical protein